MIELNTLAETLLKLTPEAQVRATFLPVLNYKLLVELVAGFSLLTRRQRAKYYSICADWQEIFGIFRQLLWPAAVTLPEFCVH